MAIDADTGDIPEITGGPSRLLRYSYYPLDNTVALATWEIPALATVERYRHWTLVRVQDSSTAEVILHRINTAPVAKLPALHLALYNVYETAVNHPNLQHIYEEIYRLRMLDISYYAWLQAHYPEIRHPVYRRSHPAGTAGSPPRTLKQTSPRHPEERSRRPS